MTIDRRRLLQGAAALAASASLLRRSEAQSTREAAQVPAELILVNGRFTSLDPGNPSPEAVAIAGGQFVAVGFERDVRAFQGPATQFIDLRGRRAIPGLIDKCR